MFANIKNSIDFFIRNNTKFSRKNYVQDDLDLLKRNRQENIYIKELLSEVFQQSEKASLQILDIGCKNWFYVRGEYFYFEEFCKEFTLDGVEVDAYRLYNNLYSRYEVAKYYMQGLQNVNYIADNLLNINKKYDYIIWMLPFVIKSPHKKWGLPDSLFYPEKLLAHAYGLLNQGGQMLIVNQGEIEAEVQKSLLDKLQIPYEYLGEVKTKSFEYNYKRFGFLINKN
ncbi:hypothetical protein IJD34_05450 [bacterium]|nr:hypothetical protein [bacterium]